jgi:hypothetical protein
MTSRALFVMLATVVLSFAWPIAVGYAACPDRPACKGCGCKGGPGYRDRPGGYCVSFAELDKICGNPPTRCVFENAPGTGANRECALASRRSKKARDPAP